MLLCVRSTALPVSLASVLERSTSMQRVRIGRQRMPSVCQMGQSGTAEAGDDMAVLGERGQGQPLASSGASGLWPERQVRERQVRRKMAKPRWVARFKTKSGDQGKSASVSCYVSSNHSLCQLDDDIDLGG